MSPDFNSSSVSSNSNSYNNNGGMHTTSNCFLVMSNCNNNNASMVLPATSIHNSSSCFNSKNSNKLNNNNNSCSSSSSRSSIEDSSSSSSDPADNNANNNNTNFALKTIKRQKEEQQGITKKRKEYRKKNKNKIEIPIHDIIRVLNLSQAEAATKLKVSLSTLKRRYYELDMGRWPANILTHCNGHTHQSNYNTQTSQLTPDSSNNCKTDKCSLKYLLNEKEVDSNYIDVVSLIVLNLSFKQHVPEI
ncbi:hypothetical protein ABK040_015572 [Willaertia magna]